MRGGEGEEAEAAKGRAEETGWMSRRMSREENAEAGEVGTARGGLFDAARASLQQLGRQRQCVQRQRRRGGSGREDGARGSAAGGTVEEVAGEKGR